jgi:hypothetical protein
VGKQPVELLRRYSNRPELVRPLRALIKRLSTKDGASPTTGGEPSDPAHSPSGPWRLPDRLSEAQIEQLIAEYRAGATIKAVAEHYGFGTTTIKRLLRQRRARRCDHEH